MHLHPPFVSSEVETRLGPGMLLDFARSERSGSLAAFERCGVMLVFLDFEASSLSKQSYPIEVAWVFEDGREEAHLIQPAPGWDEWDPAAEAIHHIPRTLLETKGTPHDEVARRMVAELKGHHLLASAPSWDGKWLSVLLRGAGLPRHSLRLRDSDEAQEEAVRTILSERLSGDELTHAVEDVLTLTEVRDGHLSAHRALADAQAERQRWLDVQATARTRLK